MVKSSNFSKISIACDSLDHKQGVSAEHKAKWFKAKLFSLFLIDSASIIIVIPTIDKENSFMAVYVIEKNHKYHHLGI